MECDGRPSLKRRRWLVGLLIAIALGFAGFLAVPLDEPGADSAPGSVGDAMKDVARRKRRAFEALLRGDTKKAAKEARDLVEGSPSSDTGSAR